MVDFRAVRRAMVDGQVRTNDVTNLALIDAMLDIPREAFVPERLAALAYLDRDLALQTSGGVTRYLLKPVVTARLVQAADTDAKDRVLVVGSGTGYAAAVVSRLAGAVVALEEDSALADAGNSSIDFTRACAYGDRSTAACNIPGSWMSAVYRASPRTRSRASVRTAGRPTRRTCRP